MTGNIRAVRLVLGLVAVGAVLLGALTYAYGVVNEGPPGLNRTYPVIIIPLSSPRNGLVHLTDPSHGVWFDMDGDGVAEHVSWTDASTEDAFLVWDRNRSGTIDSGRELFGNVTPECLKSGFMILNRWKPNALRLTADDPEFARLQLWIDRNHNGVSEPWELQPASNALYGIALGQQFVGTKDSNGNSYKWKSTVWYRDHSPGDLLGHPSEPRPVYDVVLAPADR